MRHQDKVAMNINEVWREIQHVRIETEKFSWLLGEELTRQILETMEEKE